MKYGVCIGGLCLLLLGNAIAHSWTFYEKLSDEDVTYIQERFKNSENLRESLMSSLSLDLFLWDNEIPLYKEKFGITDDSLRTVLMNIYREFEHLGKDGFSKEDSNELAKDKLRLRNSIEWLGYCADESVKRLLLDIANDDTKAECYRIYAVGAYYDCANAEDIHVGLPLLLASKNQNAPFVYRCAMYVYDETKDDTQKREAILATVATALMKEENKEIFAGADGGLAARSKDYANSPQRKATLQRMNIPLPPELEEQKKPWWKLW